MHCIENIVKETANQSGNFQISYFKDHIAKNKSVIGIHYKNSNGLLIKLKKKPWKKKVPISLKNQNFQFQFQIGILVIKASLYT